MKPKTDPSRFCGCVINSDDFFAFLTDFFAGSADYDNNGTTNSDDFFAFLNCFFNPPVSCL